MARPNPLDDPAFAQEVAKAFEVGMTRREMCAKFGVRDKDTITRWGRDPRVNAVIVTRSDLPARPARKDRGESMVYFIRGGRRIKIGCSVHPERRMADLQSCSPVTLRLMGTIPGGRKLETELHSQFADLRTHGEWFKVRRKLTKFIASVTD